MKKLEIIDLLIIISAIIMLFCFAKYAGEYNLPEPRISATSTSIPNFK